MKITKILGLLATLLLAISVIACAPESAKEDSDSLSVAVLLNGTLGDKSFFDSAANGMKMIEESFDDVTTKTIEMTYDATKWEPALLDAIDEGHDIIIAGTWQMQEVVSRIAPDYPETKFIVFDTSMNYANGEYENVYSIEYKQNDGSYLAGVLAASITETDKIGFVGGMDNTVILDFLLGYAEGAQAINPSIEIVSSFVGDFSNTAKAKELANNQYNMSVDIIFSCASTAGDGVMQSAKERNKFVIGVDSDQAELYKANDPELANLIPSSVLKRVDVSLKDAVAAAREGNLAYGTRVAVGLSEDSVGLAVNDIYEETVPADVRATIDDYATKIKDGEITVSTAFDFDTKDEILAIVNGKK